VIVSLRQGNIRVSPHLYNTENDIERLLAVVNTHSAALRTTAG
jgi:selenocysteine lyase/cysteine desulfurase